MRHILISLFLTTLFSCGQNETKRKELELKEKELKHLEKETKMELYIKQISQIDNRFAPFNP